MCRKLNVRREPRPCSRCVSEKPSGAECGYLVGAEEVARVFRVEHFVDVSLREFESVEKFPVGGGVGFFRADVLRGECKTLYPEELLDAPLLRRVLQIRPHDEYVVAVG